MLKKARCREFRRGASRNKAQTEGCLLQPQKENEVEDRQVAAVFSSQAIYGWLVVGLLVRSEAVSNY